EGVPDGDRPFRARLYDEAQGIGKEVVLAALEISWANAVLLLAHDAAEERGEFAFKSGRVPHPRRKPVRREAEASDPTVPNFRRESGDELRFPPLPLGPRQSGKNHRPSRGQRMPRRRQRRPYRRLPARRIEQRPFANESFRLRGCEPGREILRTGPK